MPKLRYNIDKRGCWNWNGSLSHNGYGSYWQQGATRRAHRVYYEELKKKIEEGKVLDHLCRNRRCVNPDHLEEVTIAENVRRGKLAKLKEEEVKEIKYLHKNGWKQTQIAFFYSINQCNVSRILNDLRWKGI
jgi:DNA-directed RNA polymerase specialized sigma subunit